MDRSIDDGRIKTQRSMVNWFKKAAFISVISTMVLVTVVGTASAALPTLLFLQGKITDTSGVPVASGDITVEIYSVSTGGSAIFSETHTSAISEGFFDVLVGSVTTLNLDFNDEYYMEVYVGATEVIGDGVNNRITFTASGGEIEGGDIAIGTITAAKLADDYVDVTGDTMTGALILPSNGLAVGTNQLVVSGGSVGIGTSSPSAKLDVEVSSGGAATIGSSLNSATGGYAVATGYNTNASGDYSTAMGYGTTASGYSSTALGLLTTGSGYSSTATGGYTTAGGDYSTARGYNTTASGYSSTAQGRETTASGYYSTAMGREIEARGDYSVAIALNDQNGAVVSQDNTMAIMGGSVGIGTTSPSAKLDVEVTGGGAATIGSSLNSAIGDYAIATGYGTNASGDYSTAMGLVTTASGLYSTALGQGTTASGSRSTALGQQTTASGLSSTAMGYGTTASGDYSTALGLVTTASGLSSTALGREMEAQGDYSVAIALNDQNGAVVSQDNTMAIMGGNVGIGTTSPSAKLDVEVSSGGAATIGGSLNSATGDYAVAMGDRTTASGLYSTAQGYGTTASGYASTAMGLSTTASGYASTATGYDTTASGSYSTAMGRQTTASGLDSTAQGYDTTASGSYSTAMGREIDAQGDYSVAIALNDQNGAVVSQDNTMAIMGGNVGIGTTSPASKLSVGGSGYSTAGIYGTGSTFGVYGSGEYGVYGSGGQYGVYGYVITTGTATSVYGFAKSGITGGARAIEGRVYRGGSGTHYSGYFYDDPVTSGGSYFGLYADERTGGAIDLAEYIKDTFNQTEAADVVIADPDNDESVIKSYKPFDTAVLGIVSTRPHLTMGMELVMNESTGEMYEGVNATKLAVAGRVPVKVTDENGPIKRGDLLTTSSKPGYAMKWTLLEPKDAETFEELKDILSENEERRNAVLGKALEPLESGEGKIVALVTLQ